MILSSQDLSELGRDTGAPFKVRILTDNGVKELEILRLLRLLPGKRLTAVAQYQGLTVVAKLFFQSASWQRHHEKELRGIQSIKKQNLLTPDIVAEHHLENFGSVILLEFLESANSLADYFLAENENKLEREATNKLATVLSLAFKLLCHCHNCGLWQRDMHLGNYLLVGDELYLIDGADIQVQPQAASQRQRLESIAEFASQFPVQWDKKLDAMVSSYSERYSGLSQSEIAKIRILIHEIRSKRLTHIEKKVFKSTTANRRVYNRDCFYVHDRTISVSQVDCFTQEPSTSFEGDPLLKNGDTTTVGQTDFANTPTVVKRYNIVSFGKWLSHLPIPSRAHKCWKNAHMLLLLGLKTPRPLMFLEERKFWIFRFRAYFLSEKLSALNLLEQLDSKDESIDKSGLVKGFEDFFQAMQDYQISHGDMKATNFIFHKGSLYILDLDGMKRHRFKWIANRKAINDIRRFEKNWRGGSHEQLFKPLIDKLYQERQVSRDD